MTPRFEFRIFGDDLSAHHAALRERHGAGLEEERTDVYFVAPGRAHASLKLRGDALDMKLLRAERDGLELWAPAARAGFPVMRGPLRDRFLAPAGIRIDLPDAAVDAEALLAAAREAPAVRLARTLKRRFRYRHSGVDAEYTRLRIEEHTAQSVGVESEKPALLIAELSALGLSGWRNTSYQRFLVERCFGPAAGGPPT